MADTIKQLSLPKELKSSFSCNEKVLRSFRCEGLLFGHVDAIDRAFR